MGSSDMDKTPKEKESKTPPATSQVYLGFFWFAYIDCLLSKVMLEIIFLSSPGAVINNWHANN